jgi:uncharacterized protein (TIGR02270 family)
VADEDIERLVGPLLAGNDLGQLTVGAHLTAAHSPGNARRLLSEVIAGASGPRLWSMIRGIEVAELDGGFAPVATALASGGPEHAAALCRLRAFRRSPPAQELSAAFESNIPALQAQALRAIEHAPDPSLDEYVKTALGSDNAIVRRAAIECGVRRRLTSAWAEAARLVHERDPGSGPLLRLLAMLGDGDDHRMVIAALRETQLQRQGLFALGYIGTSEAAEVCLVGMRDPKLARAAGEAYCTITGADLARDELAVAEAPAADSLPSFEEDALDADLVPAAQDLWPLPDPAAVGRHWEVVKAKYAPDVRHLRGRPFTLAVLLEAIESGPMMRRPDFILEAAVRTDGVYDVEPRAFTRAQQRMMAVSRSALASRVSR